MWLWRLWQVVCALIAGGSLTLAIYSMFLSRYNTSLISFFIGIYMTGLFVHDLNYPSRKS